MPKDFGIIEPHKDTGKWHWPFRVMEPGDVFRVRHSQRNPEDLRVMVSVRAAQLGKRFSFRKHDYQDQTLMLIRCEDKSVTQHLREHLDWAGIRGLLREQYGAEAQDIPWEMLDQPTVVARGQRRSGDHRWAVLAEFNGHCYVVGLQDEAVVVYPNAGGQLELWKQAQLEAMME